MYQWKTSSVIHVASILPGTNLTISQLLRLERHRGSKNSAHYGPQNEQYPVTLGCNTSGRTPGTLSQDDGDFLTLSTPAANANLRAELTTLQICVPGPSRRLLHTACSSRPVQFRSPRGESYRSTDQTPCRNVSQLAGLAAPALHDAARKPLSTQTGSSNSRLPHLVPNKLSTGSKTPIKSVKGVDDAFREVEHDETTRAWPMSSEERKAEAKKKEETRLLKEAQEKKAREAQQEAERRERAEQLQREAEALRRAEALALHAKALAREQKNKELREKWMARLSASALHLERVTGQIDKVQSQIEKLLDQRETARRSLWEKKAKTAESIFDTVQAEKERYSSLVAKCSHSSTLLCKAIGEFCMAVGADVLGKRLATLGDDLDNFGRSDFLPRYMFAEGDTPNRTASLCAIFWKYEDLKNFEEEMTAEAHIWRHLRSARMVHALNPRAFAYKPLYADWYCRTHRFVKGTSIFQADYAFWNNHTELVKPSVSSREQRGPDMTAKAIRRNDLVFFLKTGATDIVRELSRIFDYGNFDLRYCTNDFRRQQQIALRKPFTHVLQTFREAEQLLAPFVLLLRNADTRRGKISKFLDDMKEKFQLNRNLVRSYLLEVEILTYWNWLATVRHVPQKRMSYREISQITVVEDDPPNEESASAFRQIGGPDQTWRYTNFRGPNGQQVVVDYCVTDHFAERTAKLFTNKRVLGIDLWGGRRFANIDDAVKGGNSPKRCVPMLAVASEERIALFHIAAMPFESYAFRLPTLVRILEDPGIGKVGENILAIRQRLLTYLGIDMAGAFYLKSMYAWPLGSSQEDSTISSYPSPAMYSRPSTVYPPEPRTTMTLSDELKKHVGQSLRDETVNCEELQLPRIPSPQLMQLSASRPYAALQLHHIPKQRLATVGHLPSALAARSKLNKTAEFNLSLEPANKTEFTSFSEFERVVLSSSDGLHQVPDPESVGAEHDLGPTNIDPWLEGVRDYRLEKLAATIAKVVQGRTEGIMPTSHFTAYILLTRFGQSCEDIYRILHIQEPAEAILNLVNATGLPLNKSMITLLKAEQESMQASTPHGRATKWVKKIIADAPVLLRMYRRSPQTRMEFEAYAMWHRLEISVAEIAQISREPRRTIFKLIVRTLKLGNPPVFPFQRARYLSLLREYAPQDYAKELERTADEVSGPSAPWGATGDVLVMTGLESFDEGDLVRYTVGADSTTSLPTLRGTKHISSLGEVGAATAAKAAKAVKVSKTPKASKTVKAAKTMKSTSASRGKVLSFGEASRSKKKITRISTSESSSNVQQRAAKSSQAHTPGLSEKVSQSAVPRKEIMLKKRTIAENDDSSIRNKTDRVQKPKVSKRTLAQRGRRQAANSTLEELGGTRAKIVSTTGKSSSDGGKSPVSTGHSRPSEGRSLEPDIPITKVKSESKLFIPVINIESSEGQAHAADSPIRKCLSEPKSLVLERRSSDQITRPSVSKASKPSASDLRRKGVHRIEVLQEQKQEQKLRKEVTDLSAAIGAQDGMGSVKQS